MKKIFSTGITIFFVLSLYSQSFNNKILIYNSVGFAFDTSLTGASFYCYIDSNGFINWSTQAFRTCELYGTDFKPINKAGNSEGLELIRTYIPHKISSTYKFIKKGKNIIVNELITNKKILEEGYVNLEFKTLSPNFNLFEGFDKKKPSYNLDRFFSNTKLIGDTTIMFNQRRFKCYIIQESSYYSSNSESKMVLRVYIDKTKLIPIAFDRMINLETNQGSEISIVNKFFLMGILDFNIDLLKGLHIWGEKPL